MLVSLFVLPALVPIACVLWCAWWLVASLGNPLHPAYLPVPVGLSRPVSAASIAQARNGAQPLDETREPPSDLLREVREKLLTVSS